MARTDSSHREVLFLQPIVKCLISETLKQQRSMELQEAY